MINTEKNIYIQETEIKPNRYASFALFFSLFIILFSWILTEVGIFHAGLFEMRDGSLIIFLSMLLPLLAFLFKKELFADPRMKYIIVIAASIFTLTVSTLLTFHTTIMLLFPIFFAMLYRSRELGHIALFSSLFSTIFSPVIAYVLGTWDVPLFQELIAIATNGTVTVSNTVDMLSWLSVGKILLYLSFPKVLMVGSCGALMYYTISVGVEHVNAQIAIYMLSHKDALTKLYNRNCFDEILHEKKDFDIALFYFDVNGLKEANDRYGHEYGDLLLKKCAESISAVCNDEDSYAFRIGGDEFVLMVEHADREKLDEAFSKWKEALSKVNEENKKEGNGLICQIAAGYALGPFEAMEELMHKADEMMYHNKAVMKGND